MMWPLALEAWSLTGKPLPDYARDKAPVRRFRRKASRAIVNQDFRDLLQALHQTGARFLVVGAHAMAVHGVPRATGDLGVWISPDPANAERVWQALVRFGAPVGGLELSRKDLETPGMVVQIRLPPRRIDFLTEVRGLNFDEAWQDRTTHSVGTDAIPFLNRQDLIRNKRASGRPKDLADLDTLEGKGE